MSSEEMLNKIYAQIPEMECKGLCAEQFCGPIGMGEFERRRILARIGHPPESTIFPHMNEMAGVDQLKRTESLAIKGGIGCMKCPMLENGRCKIYDIRPYICRSWGAAPEMRCPHGCKPKELMPVGTWQRLGALTYLLPLE